MENKHFLKVKSFFLRFKCPIAFFALSRIIVFLVLFLTVGYGIEKTATMNQWDAPHYLSIAEKGYQSNGTYTDDGSFIAFFPLYPITVSLLHQATTLPFLMAGLILSFLFGLGATLFLYVLIEEGKGKDAAIMGSALFAFFPTSVFLSSAYTESLFALLSLACIYFVKRNKDLHAIVMLSLALITRMTGSVLALIFAWEIWKKSKSIGKLILFALISSLPFFTFLYFQKIVFGTPFAFMEAQKANWHHDATFPWTGLYLFFQYATKSSDAYAMWRADIVHIIVMLVTLFISFKKIPRDIWLFGLGVVLLSLSQTFIIGMGRFMLLVFPFYFYWGEYLSKRKFGATIVLVLSASWMTFNTILFILSKNIF